MDIRVLNAHEIRQALPMTAAVEAMKEAFAQYSTDQASVPLRSRIEVPQHEGVTLFMPAYLHTSQDMAVKIVSVFPRNMEKDFATIYAVVVALDAETGRPIALMEGASLTAIRTGAASGAATDLLARPESKTVAVFGSGAQARTQLEAVCTVREIEKVWVYSLDETGIQIFVEDLTGMGPIPTDIEVVANPAQAVSGADIICTATTSSTPVFDANDLKSGTHINAIGAFTPEMQEVDSETVRRSLLVVDSREACLAEAGDIIIPVRTGQIAESHIHAELGEIVAGTKPGRSDPDQITLFKSVGIAVQDAVAASRALMGAKSDEIGQIIAL
ncbi:MAG: ornithine cyclodeaminase family protein [Anaerolineales bacterium]|nr:ornithine cyclodeaminase family protein [Anaerolineales bacterium]